MGKARTLTDKELLNLMAHLKAKVLDAETPIKRSQAERNIVVIQLLLCGMRVGEVASLMVRDVWDNDKQLIKNSFCLQAANTKTKKSRWVYLTSSAQKALKVYLSGEGFTKVSEEGLQPLIQSNRSWWKPFSGSSLRQLVNRVMNEAGVDSTSHFGRKQLASQLVEDGVSVFHIQQVLGHADLRTTSKYLENLSTDLNDVIGKLKF